MTVLSGAGGFAPGDIFAARYRLVHELRSTPGSEVWRADDLVQQYPVAVQIVRAGSPEERDRLLRMARIARTFNHPAACRVFDAGEADGRVYCVLELVDGQSLRNVVGQAGRLPPDRVAEIGGQLCRGLAALHAAGLHPALDLSNILLDRKGRVRIVDLGFGGSGHPPEPGAATERRANARVSGDAPWRPLEAYAAGALLYELAVGRPPEAAARKVVKPSTVAADIDPRLERAILSALSGDSRRRPPSAAAMAAALMPLPGAPREDARGWAAALGAVAVVLGTLALLAVWLVPRSSAPLSEHDMIVLADFENSTGNPVFDGALKVALAVALEQSPFLRVFPDERARETLRLMQRAPDERLTGPIAREVAQRAQVKAFVTGSIVPRRGQYILAIDAVEAATGNVMASQRAAVSGDEQVLRALGEAASRLRGQLGESLASIERFDRPLPEATTPSLEALHAYAEALDHGRLTLSVDAIPHLQRAIALDSGFAMALAALSGVYRNTGRTAESPAFSRRAFELRERVSERERFFISWRYYLDAVQAWDKALELSTSWTAAYPREAAAFNSLGLASAAFGDHDQAVRAFREAIRLDPAYVPPHGNVVGSLIASNRYDEARTHLLEAQQHGIAFVTVRRMAYLLAFIDNDDRGMARELEMLRNSEDAIWAAIWEARVAAFRELTRTAHTLFQRGVATAVSRGERELAAQWTTEDAETHAIAGECEAARSEVVAAEALSRDNFTLERAARTLALCGDDAGADRLRRELQSRFPEATLTIRLHLPIVEAIQALRRGDGAGALALLERVTPFDHAPSAEFWPNYLRGEALLLRKNAAAAAREFEAIVTRRGQAPTSPLYGLAGRRLAAASAPGAPGLAAADRGQIR